MAQTAHAGKRRVVIDDGYRSASPSARHAVTPGAVAAAELSNHCVTRYRERCHPGIELTMESTRKLLRRRLAEATVSERRPSWVGASGDANAYALLDENTAIGLRWHRNGAPVLVAITCLFRDYSG